MLSADPLPYQLFHPDAVSMQLGAVVLGALLLFAGRRLFWLFVAALGFVMATDLVAPLIDRGNTAVLLGVGVIAGIAGAVLAIFVQKVAVGLAGALAGAYYLHLLFGAAALHELWWVAILAGAILGALLMLLLFKWALILFSSIAGAHLLTASFALSPQLRGALFLGLVVLGLVIQARQLRSA